MVEVGGGGEEGGAMLETWRGGVDFGGVVGGGVESGREEEGWRGGGAWRRRWRGRNGSGRWRGVGGGMVEVEGWWRWSGGSSPSHPTTLHLPSTHVPPLLHTRPATVMKRWEEEGVAWMRNGWQQTGK